MRTQETLKKIRKHPYRTALTCAAAGVAALEFVGMWQNPTAAIPEKSCLSPVATSGTFVDHSANLYAAGMFTTGVRAEVTVPKEAYGVIGSFKDPSAPNQEWNNNASQLIPVKAGSTALKFAIGGGEVQFGVQIVAPHGSKLCKNAPDVTFTHLASRNYFHADGNLPWPNLANAPANVFGNL